MEVVRVPYVTLLWIGGTGSPVPAAEVMVRRLRPGERVVIEA